MSYKDKRTIWILSELYYPEDSATGHNITNVAEGLANSFRVRALCAQPTYSGRGKKAPINEVHNNVHIHRCRATALNKDIIFFRLINLITISVSIFLNAIFRIRRGDVTLVVTNPPTLPFVAFLACKIRHAKIILRIEDVYPDAIITAGMADTSSLFIRILDKLQRYIYENVNKIIVLGRDMKKLVERKMNHNKENIVLITNFADIDQVKPLRRKDNLFLEKHGLVDRFVIQYSGNMGRTHDIETLIEAAKILQGETLIHFLFIGFGAKEQWLRKAQKDLNLKNVSIFPFQPRAELEVSLNACDLAVISFVKGMSGISVPCRMYNIMAVGKPILALADEDSELAQLVKEEQIGWVIKPGNTDDVVKAIKEAFSNEEILSDLSRHARQSAVKKYSLLNIVTQYKVLVGNLIR